MTAPRRIAYYLRDLANLHYFAAIQPYLDHFIAQGRHRNQIVVRRLDRGGDRIPEFAGYAHLLSDDSDLDAYDLVITPSFLRAEERSAMTRAVQIFHGMSDKSFTYERDFRDYLLCLCAGQRQVDRLLSYPHNRDMKWTLVGYPKFDTPPSAPRLFDDSRKTAIYCPTWRKEGLSSIDVFLGDLEAVQRIAAEINLIVKPHPNLFNPAREQYDATTLDRLQRLQRMPGVRVVRSGNVMPWFAQADLFIGDISASGYEWLYFDRPMVFLNPQPARLAASDEFDATTYLWRCGEVCDSMRDLPAALERALDHDTHRQERERLLAYSVHEARSGQATRRGVACIEALLAP